MQGIGADLDLSPAIHQGCSRVHDVEAVCQGNIKSLGRIEVDVFDRDGFKTGTCLDQDRTLDQSQGLAQPDDEARDRVSFRLLGKPVLEHLDRRCHLDEFRFHVDQCRGQLIAVLLEQFPVLVGHCFFANRDRQFHIFKVFLDIIELTAKWLDQHRRICQNLNDRFESWILGNFPHAILQKENRVLYSIGSASEHFKLLNQAVVQIDRQIRGQAQRVGLVEIERERQAVAALQQVGTFSLDAEAKLVNLAEVDHADLKQGFQLGHDTVFKTEVILDITDSLELLQQADVSAGPTAGGSGKARATTAPLEPGYSQFTNGNLRVETLPVPLVGSHVGQQCSFTVGQLFQRDILAGPAKERLD